MDIFEQKQVLKTFRILVDSREQPSKRAEARYKSFGSPYERATLSYGDYTYNATLPGGADIFNVSVDFIIGRKGNEEGSEDFSIDQYVGELHVDKYTSAISDAMKNLPEEKKKKIVDAVLFLVHNYD
jgi:hypothetical protein